MSAGSGPEFLNIVSKYNKFVGFLIHLSSCWYDTQELLDTWVFAGAEDTSISTVTKSFVGSGNVLGVACNSNLALC